MAGDNVPLNAVVPAQRVQVINLLPTARRSLRKKMRLACLPCARSKQGCDALRPCSRCIKKGTPHLCQDKEGRVSAQVPVDLATPIVATQGEIAVPVRPLGQKRSILAVPICSDDDEPSSKRGKVSVSSCSDQEEDPLTVVARDEAMPLPPISYIPKEIDAVSNFSVYHLLYQQAPSRKHGEILDAAVDNLSPMVLEDFITRSGKWIPFWKMYEGPIQDDVILSIQNKMISAAISVSHQPDKILAIVSSQSMDDKLDQLMTRNYTRGLFACDFTFRPSEIELVSSAFSIAPSDVPDADLAAMRSELSVSMNGIVPVMRVNERLTQLMCMSPMSLQDLIKDLWALRASRFSSARKCTPLWQLFCGDGWEDVHNFMISLWFRPLRIASHMSEVELLSKHGHRIRCQLFVSVKMNEWGMPTGFLMVYKPLGKVGSISLTGL